MKESATTTLRFLDGPMAWDSSRVSAAIPSGVGFLGAGLIFKKEQMAQGTTSHVVHGLTTAASLWLSAAVGIACGGGLYFAASYAIAAMMLLLRFGPRSADTCGDDDEGEGEVCELEAELASLKSHDMLSSNNARMSYGGIAAGDASVLSDAASPRGSHRGTVRMSVRKRQQAALASEV